MTKEKGLGKLGPSAQGPGCGSCDMLEHPPAQECLPGVLSCAGWHVPSGRPVSLALRPSRCPGLLVSSSPQLDCRGSFADRLRHRGAQGRMACRGQGGFPGP